MATKKVILIGGGGHASDVLAAYEAVARASGEPHPVIGLLDDKPIDERRFAHRGVRRIGCAADLENVGATHFILAVGWPAGRRALWERVSGTNLQPDTIVHPSASIPPGVPVGEGSVILANAVASEMASIGRHSYMSNGALIGHDCTVGDFVSIMPGAAISGDTVIENGCTVGTNAAVIQQVRVGAWATVGAGAIVLKDVPGGATVVGNPARIVAGPHR